MVKVQKTWDVKTCIKGTEMGKHYYCGCPACCQEIAEKAAAHTASINAMRAKAETSIAAYWTGDFSPAEKDMGRISSPCRQ
jgi:hypothetical protein